MTKESAKPAPVYSSSPPAIFSQILNDLYIQSSKSQAEKNELLDNHHCDHHCFCCGRTTMTQSYTVGLDPTWFAWTILNRTIPNNAGPYCLVETRLWKVHSQRSSWSTPTFGSMSQNQRKQTVALPLKEVRVAAIHPFSKLPQFPLGITGDPNHCWVKPYLFFSLT